jgi:ornithine cyclodeaminase/alanine dehydrogenase-like protein (mu-crystallin family)
MGDPIRYLSADDVMAAMPPVAERVDLAERTMTALVADAELPPKIGVHPRPDGSFAHAMPAVLHPTTTTGADDDLLGIKWVAGFPANRASGIPAIHAATAGAADHPPRVTIIGAGVQGHSHVEVVGHVLPAASITIVDRHPERAEELAESARRTPGIGAAEASTDPASATRAADVVITAASFTDPTHRQVMDGSWLGPDALVVPVDYATMCAASVAREAALFLVDDRGQFLANRDAGQFDDYPDPGATLGEAILAGTPRPPSGRVVVTHLGVGLADVVFGDAILRRATEAGIGTLLPA